MFGGGGLPRRGDGHASKGRKGLLAESSICTVDAALGLASGDAEVEAIELFSWVSSAACARAALSSVEAMLDLLVDRLKLRFKSLEAGSGILGVKGRGDEDVVLST